MTDLETRLRDSLTRAADDAPTATGLAARVRAARPPRRRLAAGLGAGVAVALAVVAIAVVPGLAGPDRQSGPDTPAAGGEPPWRTVEFQPEAGGPPLAMEVPGDWVAYDDPGCELDTPVGPPDVDPCVEGPVTTMDGNLWNDMYAIPPGLVRFGDGVWSGTVRTADAMVAVFTQDEQSTRRILASVRPAGDPAPSVDVWRTETVSNVYGEISAELPDDPRVRLRIHEGSPDCVKSASADGRFEAEQQADGSWVATLCWDIGGSVQAPTEALADVVAATAWGY